MKRRLAILIPFVLILNACALGVTNDVALPASRDEAGDDPSVAGATPSVSATPATTQFSVTGATLRLHELALTTGQKGKVRLDVTLSNGSKFQQLDRHLATPYGIDADVKWFSENDAIATIADDGLITAIAAGTTTIKASVLNLSDIVTVTVTDAVTEPAVADMPQDAADPTPTDASDTDTDTDANANEQTGSTDEEQGGEESPNDTVEPLAPEEPNDPSDRFLNDNDTIEFIVGENGGFGNSNMPTVIYGAPVSSRTDVVAFGEGGIMTIELGGFVIVDGDGADFTVFENAFTGWIEPAFVEVSEDGVVFEPFFCLTDDESYAGCSGVTPVNYADDDAVYLDPETSGGDTYDLADIGLTQARFIRITDANVCDNPSVCVANVAGFDLDAIAIVNGANWP